MRGRQGVQAEVMISLAMIMFTATALLLVIFIQMNHARIGALHPILARGVIVESTTLPLEFRAIEGGAWWYVDTTGGVEPRGFTTSQIDDATRALAEQAHRGHSPFVQSGAPWQPIRLAAPDGGGGGIWVGRIDPPLTGLVLAGLILIDVLIFGLFGFVLLRRRVVNPLRRLAGSVRQIRDGDASHEVAVEGSTEIAELASAFNEMQESLAARTGSLETAVDDLRHANVSLIAAREGLDRAERLAMVGSLAAGVAHEVGNPMGAMLAFLEVASRDVGVSDASRRALDRASEQGERVRVILRQLLDFSRAPQIQRVPISLEEVAHQVVELVAAQRDYADIEFEVDACAEPPAALGDRSLASQILLNLVLNAAAAIEGQETPRIRLELRGDASRTRPGDRGDEWTERREPDLIVCRVADNGPGVDADERSRIFDPFFTTKAPGQGTGLGLANALRLAEEMGGIVRLESEPSALGGACFVFALPAAGADAPRDEKSEQVRAGDR